MLLPPATATPMDSAGVSGSGATYLVEELTGSELTTRSNNFQQALSRPLTIKFKDLISQGLGLTLKSQVITQLTKYQFIFITIVWLWSRAHPLYECRSSWWIYRHSGQGQVFQCSIFETSCILILLDKTRVKESLSESPVQLIYLIPFLKDIKDNILIMFHVGNIRTKLWYSTPVVVSSLTPRQIISSWH